jgi:hypothetical protein
MVALFLLTLLQSSPALAPAQPAAPTTDPGGASIEGVAVTITGPVDREAKSPAGGYTRIQNVRAGTYRARFVREGFITFEKEFSWRAGAATPELTITLNPAPAPPPPPPPPPAPVAPPPPAAPKLPPPGTPRTLSLPEFIEKNFISGREPQKENLIGCSGVGQALLWQVREPWNGRQHESADGMLYVIGGEGRLKLGDREFTVSAGAFAVVPRGTTYSLSRSGRNPLIVLAVLAGAPCAVE